MKQVQNLIPRVQQALKAEGTPAWLLHGFHQVDPIALRILGFPTQSHITRRWFYLIPAEGEPRKLVHRIEAGKLDHLPGNKDVYFRWTQLEQGLRKLLSGMTRVAMQYAPKNSIPIISLVDAGTVELIRATGTEVVSAANLIQAVESVWTEDQLAGHRQSAKHLTEIVQLAFGKAAALIQSQGATDELTVQGFILSEFEKRGLTWDFPPIVGVNGNAGDPHYSPEGEQNSSIQAGDFLLIDLWARQKGDPEAVFADITWTGFFGKEVPVRIQEVYDVVRRARDRGVEFLRERLSKESSVEGWEVDDAVRGVIEQSGYGEYFLHRTGHNLGTEVHGSGVNFDNTETHDTRRLIPGIACTIEPGVYLDDFGVRSEINLVVGERDIEVTTPPQTELLRLAP